MTVRGLAKVYAGGKGVTDVSLSVRAGSVTGFIGVNGAGKSTTLKCILGLAEPDAGSIEIFGKPAGFSTRARIGFLPEERGIAPRERARDVISFYAQLKGLGRGESYRRADELLERVGLSDRKRARVGELSKGNAQRVQLLCALAHKPELLILDEPFTGLDPISQAEVQGLFAEHRAQGGALLFSTHSMAVAERLCDGVVILAGGKTVFQGAVASAVDQAANGAYVTAPPDAPIPDIAARLGGRAEPMGAQIGEAVRWRVILPREVGHVALTRAMAEREVALFGFEPIKADLEGAFWSLAGAVQASEAPAQAAA
ncbi:MAG TPA: ATP-binding cassette domain-containing protein [Caulobacteraceae bacterium]|nr:ATP-binding cassette domain-containing protein [Caulobacteraceae bacterium]